MKIIYNYLFLLFYILLFLSRSPIFNIDDLNKEKYNFHLYIPKISLYKKVFFKDSKENNVNKGIYLVNNYLFSNENDTVILASHSGSSRISYFKHLDLLEINNYVYTSNNKYKNIYKIEKIYKINKNGKFKYSKNRKGIYMITCDKKNDKKQIVFYGKFIKSIKKTSFL